MTYELSEIDTLPDTARRIMPQPHKVMDEIRRQFSTLAMNGKVMVLDFGETEEAKTARRTLAFVIKKDGYAESLYSYSDTILPKRLYVKKAR